MLTAAEQLPLNTTLFPRFPLPDRRAACYGIMDSPASRPWTHEETVIRFTDPLRTCADERSLLPSRQDRMWPRRPMVSVSHESSMSVGSASERTSRSVRNVRAGEPCALFFGRHLGDIQPVRVARRPALVLSAHCDVQTPLDNGVWPGIEADEDDRCSRRTQRHV